MEYVVTADPSAGRILLALAEAVLLQPRVPLQDVLNADRLESIRCALMIMIMIIIIMIIITIMNDNNDNVIINNATNNGDDKIKTITIAITIMIRGPS